MNKTPEQTLAHYQQMTAEARAVEPARLMDSPEVREALAEWDIYTARLRQRYLGPEASALWQLTATNPLAPWFFIDGYLAGKRAGQEVARG